MALAAENSLPGTTPGPNNALNASAARLRIGVIGARTRRQGIGQHVARHFAALGHDVAAIAGSSPETAAEARQHLEQAYGIVSNAYGSVDALLEHETLDAVAICSPDRFHRPHLQAAIARGVHILCEKPLVFEPCRDPAADAASLIADCRAAGKLLVVNEQWPYTLPTFEALYPDAGIFEQAPQSIVMRLSPSMAGFDMIPNSVPHLLSLVWRLCPSGGEVESIACRSPNSTQASLDIAFEYQHAAGVTDVALQLRQTPQQPRAAAYAINGRGARRVVEMSPYRFLLEAADQRDWDNCDARAVATVARRVPMPDPLALLVADFVRRIELCRAGQPCWFDATLAERLHALNRISLALN